MKFQIVIDNDDDHKYRKYRKHRTHTFECGNFYDENGPYLREHGLVHLSENFFCQKDALAFIQRELDSGKITFEEACELGRDPNIFLLPEERPSRLALYQKNETVLTGRLELTPKGKEKIKEMLTADEDVKRHTLKSFVSAVLGTFGLRVLSFFKKTPREVAKEQMREIKRKAGGESKKAP